jgi:hypothetical protein
VRNDSQQIKSLEYVMFGRMALGSVANVRHSHVTDRLNNDPYLYVTKAGNVYSTLRRCMFFIN